MPSILLFAYRGCAFLNEVFIEVLIISERKAVCERKSLFGGL